MLSKKQRKASKRITGKVPKPLWRRKRKIDEKRMGTDIKIFLKKKNKIKLSIWEIII